MRSAKRSLDTILSSRRRGTTPMFGPMAWAAAIVAALLCGACRGAESPPQTGQPHQQEPAAATEELTVLAQQAEQGNAEAQSALGILFANGEGVQRDDLRAVQWFRKAAEQGNAMAQSNLGFMYNRGRGVPQDYAQAVVWWRKAAEQGHADAQYNLGVCYREGEGVTKDDAQAAQWYRKAAEQGDARAQSNLGFMYDNGRGIPQDYEQAVVWYRRAAEQGAAMAQHNLGSMYELGQGVRQDYIEAYRWLSLAASLDSSPEALHYAEARDALAQRMASAQITDAEKRASEWMAAFERRRK